MLFPQTQISVEKGLERTRNHIEKEASALGFMASLAAGEAAMRGVTNFGKARNANFLRAGIEHGKKGEKMSPYTEGVSRNLLGKQQLAPYDAGLKIGNKVRERGMSPERGDRFIDRVVGIGSARKDRLAAETGKKVKDPVLNSLENYQMGRDRAYPGFQSLLNKGTKPQEANTTLANVAVNTAMLPAAALDFRAAARPMMRAVENNPTGQAVTSQLFPSGTKREKAYGLARDYID